MKLTGFHSSSEVQQKQTCEGLEIACLDWLADRWIPGIPCELDLVTMTCPGKAYSILVSFSVYVLRPLQESDLYKCTSLSVSRDGASCGRVDSVDTSASDTAFKMRGTCTSWSSSESCISVSTRSRWYSSRH